MQSEATMETKTPVVDLDVKSPVNDCASEVAGSATVIDIDPVKEAAARRKFDMYVVPVSFIFLVLSSLDRNNVSEVLAPAKAP